MPDVISAWPERPNRGGDPDQFDESMDATLKHLAITFRNELNNFASSINNFVTTSTSDTSLVIGLGLKSLEVEIDKGFLPGMPIRMVSAADPSNYIQGDVRSYSPSTGLMDFFGNQSRGAGTHNDWIVFVASNLSTPDQPVLSEGVAPAYTAQTALGAAFNLYEKLVLVAHATAVGTPKLARDGLAQKNIKQYNSSGVKIPGVVLQGIPIILLYDGVDYIILNPINQSRKPGELILVADNTAPDGSIFVPNSPTNLSRTDFPELLTLWGTRFGAGDGSTTFGMIWLPGGFTLLQGEGDFGKFTNGQVMNHGHPGSNVNSHNNSTSTGGGGQGATFGIAGSIASFGAAANYAAGLTIRLAVQYRK